MLESTHVDARTLGSHDTLKVDRGRSGPDAWIHAGRTRPQMVVTRVGLDESWVVSNIAVIGFNRIPVLDQRVGDGKRHRCCNVDSMGRAAAGKVIPENGVEDFRRGAVHIETATESASCQVAMLSAMVQLAMRMLTP